jgi:HlyD family secretion protein
MKKKVWIIAAVAVLAAAGVLVMAMGGTSVQKYTVKSQQIASYAESTGDVFSSDEVGLYVKNGGQVIQVFKGPGDSIKSGEILASLDKNEYQSRLQDALSQIDALKAQKGAMPKKLYDAKLKSLNILVDSLNRSLSEQDIKSSMDGTVLLRGIEKNMVVPPGTLAYKVGSTGNLKVKAGMLAEEVGDVKTGQRVIIELPGGDGTAEGKVVSIEPSAVPGVSQLGVEQRKVMVEISIENGKENLKPGYKVDIRIETKKSGSALAVPGRAVFEEDGRYYVFLAEGGRTVKREIKKGIESHDFTEVLEGLKEGDVVISEITNSISEDMRIR